MSVRTSDQACRALKHKGFFKLHLHVMFVGLLQQICICCRIRDTSFMTTNRPEHTVVWLLENVNTLTIWRLKKNVNVHFCPVFLDIRNSTASSEDYQASPACPSDNSRYECRASVEWYCQVETDTLGEKSVPLPLYPTKILDEAARYRKRDSVVKGRQLTACAMPRPSEDKISLHYTYAYYIIFITHLTENTVCLH
jgi:hypothetical protein